MEITITISESELDVIVPEGRRLAEYPYGETYDDVVAGCQKVIEAHAFFEEEMRHQLVSEVVRRTLQRKRTAAKIIQGRV